MATVIGQISSLQGIVKAINTVTGEVRVLEIGDSVFADEALQTSNGGAVMVSMLNGETLTLGRDTYMLLNDDVFGQANNIDVATEATSEVEALQAAILAGNIDLDELEETAAGEESMPGSASEGGVTVERGGAVERGSAQGEVTSGFKTASANVQEIEGVDVRDTAGRGVLDTDIVTPTAFLSSSSDTGRSDSDRITSDNTPTITGTGEAGAKVVITDSTGKTVGTGVVDADGTYSVTTGQVDDGDQTLTITTTDDAGNSSSTGLGIVIDTQPPSAPVLTLNEDTGSSDSDGITNKGGFTVSGIEPGAEVEYSTDKGATWTTGAPTAVEGENTISVRQTDVAGNVSAPSEISFTLDTSIAMPSITLEAADINNDGVYNAEELGTDGTIDAKISVGDSEVGDTLVYQINGGAAVSITLDEDKITNGVVVAIKPEEEITAQLTDKAGNSSVEVSATALGSDIDIGTPSITLEAADINNDGVYNAEELGTDGTIDAKISVGDSEVGDTLVYQINGGAAVSITLDEDKITNGVVVAIKPEEEITAQLTDKAGNSSVEVSATALGSDIDTDTRPTMVDAVSNVSEEGLAGGILDDQGDPADTTDSVTASGRMSISDADGDTIVSVTVTGPAGITSGGVAVVWTGTGSSTDPLIGKAGSTDVASLVMTTDGSYNFVLLGPLDHPVEGVEDVLPLEFSVIASDGTNQSDPGTLTINVEDDMPVAPEAVEQTLDFYVSEVKVGGFEAGFDNWILEKKNSSTNFDAIDKDLDTQIDEIKWGNPVNSNQKSGYEFVDNEGLRDDVNGQSEPGALVTTFNLGKFIHNNFPTHANTNGLKTVDLVVKLNVVIDGVVQTIEHTIKLKHTETPNSSNFEASKDIVEISQQSLVQVITVGEREYEFKIDGFKDVNGDLVTTIRTAEDAASSFDLFATLTSKDPLPVTEGDVTSSVGGEVSAFVGADGFKNGAGITWDNATDNLDGSYTITNKYGIFTGYADGKYEFEMSAKERDGFDLTEPGQKVVQTYTITDADGDSVQSSVTINLNGKANPVPTAYDENNSLVLDIPGLPGLTGRYYATDKQLNSLTDVNEIIGKEAAGATFIANTLSYEAGKGDLASAGKLKSFLGDDAGSLSFVQGAAATGTDAILTMEGHIYLKKGKYNFKVKSDDGYSIKIGEQAVAIVNKNQSSKETTHSVFTIDKPGYYPIEIVYWDQGEAYVFEPMLRYKGGAYKTLEDYPLMQEGSVNSVLSGNVMDNIDFGLDGPAESGGIKSIEIEGTTYKSSDYVNNIATFDTSSGTMVFNFLTGKYTFTSNGTVGIHSFTVTAADATGDQVRFDLNLTIVGALAVEVIKEDFDNNSEGWVISGGQTEAKTSGKQLLIKQGATVEKSFSGFEANEAVSIQFDLKTQGGWESRWPGTGSFKVLVNGEEVFDNKGYFKGVVNLDNVVADAAGNLTIELNADSTWFNEKALVDNFIITRDVVMDNILYGDDNLAEAFIVNPKADLVINKFDLKNDVLDLSEVLGGTGTQVTQETLDAYLDFNDGEITIDSGGGLTTKVTFKDVTNFDDTNISNNKIVIQIDDEKYDYSGG